MSTSRANEITTLEIPHGRGVRPWVRLAASALALALALAAGEAVAGEPAAAAPAAENPALAKPRDPANEPSPAEAAYMAERRRAKQVRRRQEGEPLTGVFDRQSCMTDPAKCTCQSQNAQDSLACGDVLGYFCPDSTLKYLASSCIDLLGGATVCKCASNAQIKAQIDAEDAAAKKAAAAEAKKAKSKKKSAGSKKK